MPSLNRRAFITAIAAAALAREARANEPLTPDQTLDELINQNQNSGLGSGFDSAPRNINLPKPSLPTLSAATAETTQTAVAQYQAMVAKGGWPEVPAVAKLVVGGRHPAVPALRERLQVAGDLDLNSGDPQVFDSYVEAAVHRFQLRHGLNADGVVRDATWRALNVPAEIRLAQLKTNLARLKSLTGNLGDRLVVANIPAAQVEAIENGVAVTRHAAVVGQPERPSPDLQSKIVGITFNPSWTVPVGVIRKDLVPKLAAEPDYLTRNHIRIFDPNGDERPASQLDWNSAEAANLRFRQGPGDFSLLGRIRIEIPSAQGVYMHDTPSKNLFGEDFALAAPGSMRVQNIRELAYWILAGSPSWPKTEIDQLIGSGEPRDAMVARPLPLYWVYITAWAAPDGVVQFRDDIYNRDGFGSQTNPSRG
jgi:murein L,D-transpeptidase YcbB/YkuD